MARESGHVIDAGIGLLAVMVFAVAFGAALLIWTPDPFQGLEFGDRPPRLFVLMRVGGLMIVLLGLYRVATWASWRVGEGSLERRGWFSRRRYLRSDLITVDLDQARGIPPSFELRFRTGRARFVAKQLSARDHAALRAFVGQEPPATA